MDSEPWGYCPHCARIVAVVPSTLVLDSHWLGKHLSGYDGDSARCLGSFKRPGRQPGPDVPHMGRGFHPDPARWTEEWDAPQNGWPTP